MKFTSEDLMKAMGLQVGDRIKVKFDISSPYFQDTTNCICEIIQNIKGHIMIRNENNQAMFMHNLVDYDYEILPKPKRVGDLKCDDFAGCDYGCPLMWLCCNHRHEGHGCNISLYNVLNFYEIDDQEIHDLLKARLDKVVEE